MNVNGPRKYTNNRTSSDSAVASVLIVGGIMGFFVMFIYSMLQFAYDRQGYWVQRAFLSFLLSIVIVVVFCKIGFGILSLVSRYKKLCRVIDELPPGTARIGIGWLVGRLGKNLDVLSPDLYRMIRRGYLRNASIDLEHKELVLDPQSIPAVKDEASRGTVYSVRKKYRPMPFILAVLIWLLTVQIFTLSEIWVWPAATMLAITALLLGLRWFPPNKILSVIPRPVEAVKPVSTGNTELDEILASALTHTSELVKLERSIGSNAICKSIDELLVISKEIFEYVEEHPEKCRQIRQFVNYYLPSTVKLLKSYDELSAQPEKGENISSSIEKIEETIPSIVEAFRNEYDMLYLDKAMDISADIAVMKTMMEYMQEEE